MSFASESRERARPVLPLAGMVDILFLLLVFFLTASVFRQHERQIDVSLPGTQTAIQSQSKTPIVLTLTETGKVFIGDRQYDLKGLANTLKKLASQFPNESVVIRGDKASSFGLAVRVMDIARSAGLYNISIATSKLQSEL